MPSRKRAASEAFSADNIAETLPPKRVMFRDPMFILPPVGPADELLGHRAPAYSVGSLASSSSSSSC
ncbi:hypothetical protein IMZ48_26115 [Candidatus Bathyarchaeota archaeon]|nr:hypothetical protein [Candidatus Bathyarchaeota archaeon]